MGVARVRDPGLLLFGAGSLTTTATTRFLYPGRDDELARGTPTALVLSRDVVLSNLQVHVDAPGTDATFVTYTVLVDGVPSALVVNMLATATTGLNTNQVPVSAGAEITLRVTKAAALTARVRDVSATIEVF